MFNILNLKDTIIPKSDQLNSEQLLGSPMTIRVSGVSRGNAEQPIIINYDGDNGRPYKPCKSMRKVLIFAWGEDGNQWIGKSMTVFCDQNVKWAGEKVGGIRISHLSDIERDISVALTATRGRKDTHIIKKLVIAVQAANQILSKEERELAVKDMQAAPDVAALQTVLKSWHKAAKDIGDKDSIAFFNSYYKECELAFA
mgnify:CR=1 FL=1